MRILIPLAAASTLAAAAAAAMALHAAPSRSSRAGPVPVAVRQSAPPSEAVPGLVWRSGTAVLRLTDRPCPSEDFKRTLETEGVTEARAYDVSQGTRHYGGCWAKDIGGDVLTMEPGRELGSIPLDWFRREAG